MRHLEDERFCHLAEILYDAVEDVCDGSLVARNEWEERFHHVWVCTPFYEEESQICIDFLLEVEENRK